MLQQILNMGPSLDTSFSNKSNKFNSKRHPNIDVKKRVDMLCQTGPKMMPKPFGKSTVFLNGPRWMVFRRSLVHYNKIMFREDSGLQK